jgi:diguanylate cyclase (GGDEF)-like protein
LPTTFQTKINPLDFLEALRRFPALEPFHLALSCEQELLLTEGGQRPLFCDGLGKNTICDTGCRASFEKAFRDATQEKRPVIFQCPIGLFNFAVPFRNEQNQACCLFAGGVREETLARPQMEKVSNAESADGATLLEKLDQRPRVNRQQLEEAMAKTMALIPVVAAHHSLAQPLQKMTQRLDAIASIAAEIDRTRTFDEAITLLAEALIILFDLSKIAILLTEGDAFCIKTVLGMENGTLKISNQKIFELLSGHADGKPIVLHQEIDAFFPQAEAERVICIPLAVEGRSLGMVTLFDIDLHHRDLTLIELLTGRVSAKLLRLKNDDEHGQSHAATHRLITMISELSLFDNCEALHRNIVVMCCELLGASRGSLMLIDQSGESLRIAAAKGINLEVARSTPIPMGQGISGRVAKSGLHLLVSDIEKDCRVGIPNRPRFKTKSFICFPLKVRDRIIGVLNLADKETGGIFTDTDLKHLHILAGHAGQMIDRTAAFEKAQKLEELAVRDPLTGLYNRRLLETRFHEELNRCSRLKQPFTIIMVDLDYFKTYNDQCGHIAGDNALRKVATLLKKSAREMDFITRYGGEEFCLMLPNTAKEEALFVAERIRRAIENEPFPGETGLPQGKLTTSIGIASYPGDGEKFETLVNAADLALYQAKSKGRNRLATFEPLHQQRPKKTG